MAGEGVSIPASEQAEDATRTKILAAAMQCFLQLGIAKTSLQDVARAADISRGTVYRYFADRRTLIDATIEQNVQNYYDEATEAMASTTTLAAQIGAFGEVFARNVDENRRHDVVTDESELLRLLATDLDGGLRRMSTFLVPYVEQAKERGELALDVEEHEASELLARMLMTLTVMPLSVAFDMRRPHTVGRFLEHYAVDGLAAVRASR